MQERVITKGEFSMDFNHEWFMKQAIKEAEKAFALNEVPIGAVVVYKNEVIGKAYNMRNTKKNPLAHAEIQAIDQAAKKIQDWRLEGCTMYVTLEPCPMCAGAIVQARIPAVVYGAKNPKAGCAGSIMNLLENNDFNHQVEVIDGILEKESRLLLQTFFKRLRDKN